MRVLRFEAAEREMELRTFDSENQELHGLHVTPFRSYPHFVRPTQAVLGAPSEISERKQETMLQQMVLARSILESSVEIKAITTDESP
jgi:hypothetical protein